jgi:hypothetical protein
MVVGAASPCAASEAISADGDESDVTAASVGLGLMLPARGGGLDSPIPHLQGSLVRGFTGAVDGELALPIFVGPIGMLEIGARLHFGGEHASVGLRAGGSELFALVGPHAAAYTGYYGGVIVSFGSRAFRITATYDVSRFPRGTSEVSDAPSQPTIHHRPALAFEVQVSTSMWVYFRGGALVIHDASSSSEAYPLVGAGVSF